MEFFDFCKTYSITKTVTLAAGCKEIDALWKSARAG
jgi:hypothetical protein